MYKFAMPRGQHGRPGQRRRTRQAILDAATRLLAGGASPSIAEVAAAADVSRRTVYMYFPTLEQLLIDATLGLLGAGPIDRAVARVTSSDARERVEALTRAILDASDAVLPLGRRLIRLTVEQPPRSSKEPLRGHRRVKWVEQAIEPLRKGLSKEQHARLAAALTILVGWEAIIVLRDVCRLDRNAERRVMTWATRTLIDGMLTEQRRRR